MKSSIKEKAKTSIASLFKSGIGHTVVANTINKAIGMLSSMVITRVLSSTDYGILGYALNIFSYLTLVSGFGLVSGNIQFGAESKGTGKAYSYYRYCLSVGLIINIGLVITSSIIVSSVDLPIEGSRGYVISYIPLLLLEYIISITQGILRSKNRIKEYARYLNINSITIALGTCIGAFFGVSGVIIGRYIASIITVWCSFLYLKDSMSPLFHAGFLNGKDKKALWKFSVIIGACSALNLVVYSLDVTIIANMIKSADEIAYYKVGTVIPSALSFLPNSIITAILPNIIYHNDDLKWIKNNLKKVYSSLLIINFSLSVVLIAAAPLIIRIVSGESYSSSVPVFRVLILGYFFSGTFRGLSVNLLSAFRRVNFSLLISITTCLADVILNCHFINQYGMIGAAYATLCVDIISSVMGLSYVIYLLRKGTINELVQNNC